MKVSFPVLLILMIAGGLPITGWAWDNPCKGTKQSYQGKCRYPDQIRGMKDEAKKKSRAAARRKALKRKRAAKPTPSEKDKPAGVVSHPLVSFESKPDGATVVVDGQDVCTTPCQSPLGPGRHAVQMRKPGHAAAFSSVLIQGPQTISWTLQQQLHLGPSAGLIRILEGHGGAVSDVAFSPDGRSILSGSLDHSVRLWNAHTGQVTRVFQGHTGRVNAVSLGTDGRTAVSGGDDHSVNVWNVSDGRLMKNIRVGQERVLAVAMSPGGRTVLWGGSAGTLQLVDVQSGLVVSTFVGHQGRVGAVTFSKDGMQALSGGGDKLYLWDVHTGFLVRTLAGHAGAVLSVTFTPDGRYGLTGGADHTVRFWDLRGGRNIRTFPGHGSNVTSVAFHPEGRMAMSASSDETIRIWEVRTGRIVHTFATEGSPLLSARFSRDGRYLVSGGLDSKLHVWRLDAPGTVTEERCYQGALSKLGKALPVITRLSIEPMTGQVAGGYTYLNGTDEVAGSFRALSPLKKGTAVALEWRDEFGSGPLNISFMGGFVAFTGLWADGQATPSQRWYGKLVGCDMAQLQHELPGASGQEADASCQSVQAHLSGLCGQSNECVGPLQQLLQNGPMFLQACETAMTRTQRACMIKLQRFVDIQGCM